MDGGSGLARSILMDILVDTKEIQHRIVMAIAYDNGSNDTQKDKKLDTIMGMINAKILEARIAEMEMIISAESEAWRYAGTEANPSGEPIDAAQYASDRIKRLGGII